MQKKGGGKEALQFAVRKRKDNDVCGDSVWHPMTQRLVFLEILVNQLHV